MDVFIVWYKDLDIYRSHVFHGVYKNKLDAIQYVKDLGAKQGVDVESETDDSYMRKYFVDEGSKLVASYCIKSAWFTVERTVVQ